MTCEWWSIAFVWNYPISLQLFKVKVFIWVLENFFDHFSIKTYFIYLFIYLLFKIPHIRLFILHYITLKCQFFLIVNLFSHILSPSHFVCLLFHFRMSQNIVMFLKIKVINLLMFLLYPYYLLIQFFDKFI